MNNLILDKEILTLSKKELQALGKRQARMILDDGWKDAVELLVNSKKLTEMLNAFTSELKEEALSTLESAGKEGVTVHGSQATVMFTGDRLNYMEDAVYANLKKQLDDRVALLKLAQKQNIADADSGEFIPKVGIKTYGVSTPKVTL